MRSIPLIDLSAQQARIRQSLDRRIARVLDHGQYIMGPEIAEIEQKLAAFCGARHAISCSSGTDALLIAMMAKGVKAGDGILCPGFTYTATPETIALLGAVPIFIDVDPETYNITADSIDEGVKEASRMGIRAVAVVAVDLFGLPAPYPELKAAAQKHNLWILGDAAQSFGASLGGKKVGTLCDITTTSFFPAKPLGCYGDGGAIFTDDSALADVMRSIRLHGKGDDKYDIVRVGVNGRLDTLQAAILLEKIEIFEDEIRERNAIAERYSAAFGDRLTIPRVAVGYQSVWAQYTLRLQKDERDHVAARLKASGIASAIYYPRAVHHQPAYARYWREDASLPVCEALVHEVLSIPMHPYLSESDQRVVIEELLVAVR